MYTPPTPSRSDRRRDAEAARAGPLIPPMPGGLTDDPPMLKPDEEWREVEIVIEDKGPDYAHACTVESNDAIQQQHHVVETKLVWPNTAGAGAPLGQFPFYVIKFTEEKQACVVTPLYVGERVGGGGG